MIQIQPIGYVENNRDEIKDDYWGSVISKIELVNDLDESALMGIGEFSHLEILFYFDKVKDEKIETSARHPRGNPDYPLVGIFAQRGKNRPNKLGITTVEFVKQEGKNLYVKGLDAINGTPVLDIKPIMAEFLPRGEIKQPKWSKDLMKNYWE